MARSMTGFGYGEYFLYDRRISVEIKSVNSRYLEMSIKLPKIINIYENDIKNILKEEIQRGKVDVFINILSDSSEDTIVSVDEALLDKYYEKICFIKEKYNLFDDLSLKDLISFDGVLKTSYTISDVDYLAQVWETLFVSINNALDAFVKSRETEGNALKVDILLKIEELEKYLMQVLSLSDSITKDYEERLTKKIASIIDDPQRLMTEVAIFADKSSIDEEIVRLTANISSFKSVLNSDDVMGRKLDFIVQEMNREVNTISSKSQNINLTKNCVEMKTLIEKIREQIQNIE